MARLFHAGAEIDGGDTSPQSTFNPDGNKGAAVSRDTTTFRSGVASWKSDSGAGNTTALTQETFTFVDGRSYFFRSYVNAAAAPSAASTILGLGTSGAFGLFARLRTDGAVELLVSGAVQGSPSAVITDGSWHRIELKGVATATTTWTASELLVDGVSVATWSGSIARNAQTAWGWGMQSDPPGANKVIYTDDVALNDSTGAANTTYPGSGKVVLLKPISDNARGTGWTGGAAGTTNLWDAVNNTPPLGVADTGTDTSQIRNATSNASVSYDANMTTYTTAGVGASDTLNAIINWVATAAPVSTGAKQGLVGNASNPAVTTVALGTTGTSGAFWAGAAGGTYGGGWKWSPGTMTDAPSVTLGNSPVMRITQVTSSTRIADVCAMFIYADYTPFVASGRFPRNPAIDFADPAFV